MTLNDPEPLVVHSSTGVDRPLVLKFGGSLVEQLGAQLYPSVTATVAELISNAWDADARNVWVTIPFEEDWTAGAEIVVLDDGHGMTRRQAQETYLVVGRRKRTYEFGDRSEGGRLVHGRKGIGKLAAFGTAGYLECFTIRDGEETAFGIDYDELRRLNPDQNYYVDRIGEQLSLLTPSGERLAQGTRIRLTKLRVKRKISSESFQLSMSRRFALREMNVLINGVPLRRFDIPLQFKLPRDMSPEGVEVDDEGWGNETLPSGDRVRWWIGFTEKPLTDGDQQGISVLARQKMAQRPFKFERSQGTTAQLGFEYMVGEVEADWLDSGSDIDSDFIQSNRDQLQLENERLDEFVLWGRRRLSWAVTTRLKLKERLALGDLQERTRLDEVIGDVSQRERRALHAVADKLARVPEIDAAQVRQVMGSIMDARAESQLEAVASEIRDVPTADPETYWNLLEQTGAMDARRLISVIDTRIAAIDNVLEWIASGPNAPSLADRVSKDIWLLDPRLHLFAEPVDVSKIGGDVDSTASQFKGLLILRPSRPAPADEVAVVQLLDSQVASEEQVVTFAKRATQIARRLGASLQLRGLMVAPKYSSTAMEKITQIESQSPIQFLDWDTALNRSRAIHSGLLSVSRRRAEDRN